MKPLEPIDYVPGYSFWVDGCEKFVRSVIEVLYFAGEDCDSWENVEKFLHTIPTSAALLEMTWWKKEYFNTCCKAAYEATRGTPDEKRVDELLDYFLREHVERTTCAKSMLRESMAAVFLGVKHFFEWKELRCKTNSKTMAPETSSLRGRISTFWRSCVSAMRPA